MPNAAADVLADLAVAVLTASTGGMTADGITVPDRTYVHPGPGNTAAWDCEQVVVSLEKMETGGRPGAGGQRNVPPRGPVSPLTATFMVQVVLCVPTVDRTATGGPDVPADTDETAAARALLAAGYSARRGVADHVKAGTLVDLQPDAPTDQRAIRYERAEVGDLLPSPRSPSGGMGCVTFTVRIRL